MTAPPGPGAGRAPCWCASGPGGRPCCPAAAVCLAVAAADDTLPLSWAPTLRLGVPAAGSASSAGPAGPRWRGHPVRWLVYQLRAAREDRLLRMLDRRARWAHEARTCPTLESRLRGVRIR